MTAPHLIPIKRATSQSRESGHTASIANRVTALIPTPKRGDGGTAVLTSHDDRGSRRSAPSARLLLLLRLYLRLHLLRLRRRGRNSRWSRALHRSVCLSSSTSVGTTAPAATRVRNRKLRGFCHAIIVSGAPVAALGTTSPVAAAPARTRSRGNLISRNIRGAIGALDGSDGGGMRRSLQVRRSRLISSLLVEAAGVADGLSVGGATPQWSTSSSAVTKRRKSDLRARLGGLR